MELDFDGRKVPYVLVRKKVKNINARIKEDGIIYVSASPFVPRQAVETFLLSQKNVILRALNQTGEKKTAPVPLFAEADLKEKVLALCEKVYPYYEKKGILYPEIRFRKMVSQWGNCRPKKGVLTFSTNLRYANLEIIEYVVYHEFTHFLVPDHSSAFYGELEKVCPFWKERRNQLREIRLR